MNYEALSDREIDELIAKRILGIPKPLDEDAARFRWAHPEGPNAIWYWDGHDDKEWYPAPFSSDIASAWRVVEKMRELGYWMRMGTPSALEFVQATVIFEAHREINGRLATGTANHTSPERAICIAALCALDSQEGK